ncbi:MAG: hypothetical protein HY812_05615 [Planctomycetes bacterium]|nr:hypothetical protein [Planctomycetota bacterium]
MKPLDKGKDVRWPDDGAGATVGPGMFWCRIGKKIHVKNAWSSAAASGVKPGMEVVTVNGAPAAKWLEARIEEIRDTQSYSTDQQAFFSACHWGLADAPGARMELEVADTDGKKKKRTVTYTKASVLPDGPAFPPPDLQGTDDVRFGTTPKGYAYIHVRRCPDNLPELTDQALAAVGDAPGLILDFRACGGGAFDHEAFLGRFVPKGETLSFAGSYPSAGESPYGGPIVVIVDAGARSAGETGSGIFKEDGRAYLIGESPTAGMSSQKTTIELPSGLFALYVSVRSNKAHFNNGRGIEGIGVLPHEIVEYDPRDLAQEQDTLILRAEKLLERFPQKDVPYDPAKFGWKR